MSEPIKVGIIGQGRSGRDIHGVYLVTDPRFKIVAVVDALADRRERAAREYGCEAYAGYRKLLRRKDLDLVVNASFSFQHVPITLAVLKAGFNVLCEKPLAPRARDVDRLIDQSQKSGRLLAVFQQSRFAPYFEQIKKVIASGVLGRIVQINLAFNGFARRWDWQTLQEFRGGNLLNTGPHPLDQALRLYDSEVMPEVTCYMDRANTYGDAEDHVTLTLRGPGRPFIVLEISSCCPYPTFTYNIYGTRGGLKASTSHMDWKYYVPEENAPQELKRQPIAKPDGTPAYCTETLTWHEESWDLPPESKDLFGSMSKAFYNMLHRTLTEGAPLEITPQQVRQQIAVIQQCQKQNPEIYLRRMKA
jgi:predicted dehydrogenase